MVVKQVTIIFYLLLGIALMSCREGYQCQTRLSSVPVFYVLNEGNFQHWNIALSHLL